MFSPLSPSRALRALTLAGVLAAGAPTLAHATAPTVADMSVARAQPMAAALPDDHVMVFGGRASNRRAGFTAGCGRLDPKGAYSLRLSGVASL